MRKVFLIVVFFCLTTYVKAQDMTHNITSYEADSLVKSLITPISDSGYVTTLLRLAEYNILKPGNNKNDIDSAGMFLGDAERMNAKIRSQHLFGEIYLVTAYLHREKNERLMGRNAVQNAIKLLKKSTDKRRLGLAYFELAEYDDLYNPAQLPEKIHLMELASSLFDQSGNMQLRAFSLKMLADLYNFNEDSYKALTTAKLSLKVYLSIHYRPLQGIYCLIGSIYYGQGDFLQGLNYELSALRVAKNLNDNTMQYCEINNYIGLIYNNLQKDDKAIVYFQKALTTAEQYNDNTNIILLIFNMSNSYIHVGKTAEGLSLIKSVSKKFLKSEDIAIGYLVPLSYANLYTSLKKYRDAKPYCNQLIQIASLRETKSDVLCNIYLVLAKFFIASGNYNFAKKYLTKNEVLLGKTRDPLRISSNYNFWFRLDTTQNNYKAAIRHLLMFNRINDSVLQENKIRQIKKISSFYENEEKENEIKIRDQNIRLLKQENQIQLANLGQANIIKKVTVAGALVLIVILGLLYRQYLKKKKSSLEKSEKNELLQSLLTEKEWLLKEVHHRVKNNLHTVICLLESQAAYLKNDALKAVENSQHRIYAMSLIHQQIYRSEDIKTIDMSTYLPEFIQYLKDSFENTEQIRFQLNVEPLKLGLSQAVPLALIINEAVSNSVKYAFPKTKTGLIEITMYRSAGRIKLLLADNGIGINSDDVNNRTGSLGIKLIHGLSEDINAQVNIENEDGVRITIIFDVDPLNDNNSPLATFERNKRV